MDLDINKVFNTDVLATIKDVIICCICTGILYNPQQCSVCENNFCLDCISKWRKSRNSCPMKCENFIFKESSKLVKKMLNKLQFTCLNNCTSTLNYTDLFNHLNYECPERYIYCSECGEESKVKHFLYHKSKELKELDKILNEYKTKLLTLENTNVLLLEENNSLKEFGNDIGESYKSVMNDSNKEETLAYLSNLNSEEIEFSFPFKIYKSACEHYKNHNFVCIFSCCSKAFPCFMCHDTENSHSYSEVVKGYCNRCLTIIEWEKTLFCPNCGLSKLNQQL